MYKLVFRYISKVTSCNVGLHLSLASTLKARLQSGLYPYTLPIELFMQFLYFALQDVCAAVKS